MTLGLALAMSIVGMFAGTVLANRLLAMLLRRGFAWCVVLLGVALVGGNLIRVVHAN